MPKSNSRTRTTHAVSAEIFKQVYDSPRALPGRYRWVTRDEDVRVIEDLLGMKPQSIVPSADARPIGWILWHRRSLRYTLKNCWPESFWANKNL